ncbi:MAG: flagellar basal body-associated FliL family protein [Bdellovibrionota bacterium]|nr:flagellar basal body-associated FliL family protein [Bdellovibrionota bacterium]|tara:strand:+ start:2019 stop:2567 length:549 start_codon:yes stop_codon:yes gene_type:complete
MAEEEAKPEGGGDEGSSGKNPLLLIITLVNAILMGVIAFLQWQSHQAQKNQESVKDVVAAEMKKMKEAEDQEAETGEAKEQDGINFTLDPFTANLAQGDGPRRYLRLKVVLRFSKTSSEEEFRSRKAQIRDTVITIINSKRPTDVLKLEGKNNLKEELKAAINTYLIDGSVINVYYTQFQVN